MHQKKSSYTARPIRFHQWSRKAYAVFASLKRHVTMGCVRKGITEVSLSKGAVCVQAFASKAWMDKDAATDFEEAEADSGGEEVLLRTNETPLYAPSTECGGSCDRGCKRNEITMVHRAPVFVEKRGCAKIHRSEVQRLMEDTCSYGNTSSVSLCVRYGEEIGTASSFFYLAYGTRIEEQGFGKRRAVV